MIILVPIGGMCNRLRVIKSAVNVSQKYNQKLLVFWLINNDLACRYEDLFYTTKLFRVVNLKGRIGKIILKAYKINTDICLLQDDMDEKQLYFDEFDKHLSAYLQNTESTIYISTYQEFYNGPSDYSWLKPIEQLQRKVDEICGKVGNNGIGIHIRRTDDDIAIKNSPTELFINAIKMQIAKNPECKFFLATDDMFERKTILTYFGSKIIVQDNIKQGRQTKEGMRSSVIDLFCLARMSKIYGSYWSSFTEEASKIYGAERIIIKK